VAETQSRSLYSGVLLAAPETSIVKELVTSFGETVVAAAAS